MDKRPVEVPREHRVRMDLEQLDDGLGRAFARFLELYAVSGGHRHYGFNVRGDPRNYQGPLIWTEGDCQFRLALSLEEQFPGMVHVEVPLAKYTIHDYEPKIDARQFIDIVVSDLSSFDVERDVFAKRPHDLFVEVKYVGHGTGTWAAVGRRTISGGVKSDLERLKKNLDRCRCRAAALLLIDDNSYLEEAAGKGLPWDPRVRPLLASPTQLARAAAAKERGVALPAGCPKCGSPRVAAILWGMPPPDWEAAAERHEVAIGGCVMIGDGLDATFRCLDCQFVDAPEFDPDSYAKASDSATD